MGKPLFLLSNGRAFVAAALLVGCSGRGECPRRVVPDETCKGEDLQCAYEVPVISCGTVTQVVSSSCGCTQGRWVCPGAQTVACAEEAAAAASNVPSDTPTSTADGTGASGSAISDAGPGMYSTTAEASTATKSAAPRTSAPIVVVASDAATVRTSIKPSSCPLLMVWNGSRFQYETDVGGFTVNLPAEATANRALLVPGGGTFYHKLPHARFDASTGLAMRIRESVSEIAYVDELKLVVVDHPAGYEIWSSGEESTNEWGYVEPFAIHTTRAPRTPIQAFDREGRDVLSYLAAADNLPAPVAPDLLDGDYTLDFGSIDHPERAKLLIEGWSIYLVQAPEDVQPFLEAQMPDGTWTFVRRFGAPYGDFKTVVLDLAGRLPAGARLLRVHLGMEKGARWVIDRIRLDESEDVPTKTATLDPVVADLVHRGRATLNRPSMRRRQDALDDENEDDPLQYGHGAFTRYGDVRDLLRSSDSQYVIMRHGDQLTVAFPGAAAPEPGWERSVVLKVNDTMKTFFFDSNTEPLPFEGMKTYPYGANESYPEDAAHAVYRSAYNTRVLSAP